MNLGLLLLVLSCESAPENYVPEPNVYCILSTEQSRTRLLAGMSVDVLDTTSTGEWYGVRGVTGSVRDGQRSIVVTEAADSAGYYRVDSFTPLPGGTCTLELHYPTGEVVQGWTLVPERCSITGWSMDTVIQDWGMGYSETLLEVNFAWHRAGNARHHQGEALGFYDNGRDTMTSGGMWVTSSDTSITCRLWFQQIRWREPETDTLPLRALKLEIEAWDRNYYQYRYAEWGESPRMYLDGALGVFGSISRSEQEIPLAD